MRVSNKYSKFKVQVGVHQGLVLNPLPFIKNVQE